MYFVRFIFVLVRIYWNSFIKFSVLTLFVLFKYYKDIWYSNRIITHPTLANIYWSVGDDRYKLNIENHKNDEIIIFIEQNAAIRLRTFLILEKFPLGNLCRTDADWFNFIFSFSYIRCGMPILDRCAMKASQNVLYIFAIYTIKTIMNFIFIEVFTIRYQRLITYLALSIKFLINTYFSSSISII